MGLVPNSAIVYMHALHSVAGVLPTDTGAHSLFLFSLQLHCSFSKYGRFKIPTKSSLTCLTFKHMACENIIFFISTILCISKYTFDIYAFLRQ